MTLTLPNINGNAEVHLDALKAICGNTIGKSMIDIGCGFARQTRLLGFYDRVYIDIVKRDLEEENANFFVRDILEFSKKMYATKVDVMLSLDNIEHFWEDDARRLLQWMESNSHKQIIFTPQGRYMNVDDENNNDPDTHKYSWTDDQFQEMGWATITFPNFHPTFGEGGLGAFFAFKCENLESEFNRAVNELKTKHWYKTFNHVEY